MARSPALVQMLFDLCQKLTRAVGLGDVVVTAGSTGFVFVAAECI